MKCEPMVRFIHFIFLKDLSQLFIIYLKRNLRIFIPKKTEVHNPVYLVLSKIIANPTHKLLLILPKIIAHPTPKLLLILPKNIAHSTKNCLISKFSV